MIQISDLNKKVIDDLINNKLVPSTGNFNIDEDLLFAHRQIYATYGGGKTNKYLKSRRYAGLGLLNEKKLRKIPTKDIKEGFIYLIKNPAWPDKTKIGITIDLNKRLSNYQTYDPYRSFYIESYEFITNKSKVEKETINLFSNNTDLGEWVTNSLANNIILDIRAKVPAREGELIYRDSENKPIKLNDRVRFITHANKCKFGNIIAFKSSGLEINCNGIIYKQILPIKTYKMLK